MKVKLILMLMCVFVILTGLGNPSSAMVEVDEECVTNYLIKTCSEEWLALESRVERVKFSQVPSASLKTISTESLIEVVINYPLLIDLFAFGNYRVGFTKVLSEYNGLQELINRQDSGIKLLDKYSSMDILQTSIKQLEFIEVMLAQPEFQGKLTEEELMEFHIIVYTKMREKHRNISTFGSSYETFYIANQESSPPDEQLYQVLTPNGSRVVVQLRTFELTQKQIEDNDKWVRNGYPNVTIVRSASRYYNCHTYAWYQTLPSPWWMPYPEKYMTDGSYNRVVNMRQGDRIYYPGGRNDHSGIVAGVAPQTVFVTSKWVEYGLINHRYDDCPYYVPGMGISFWRRP